MRALGIVVATRPGDSKTTHGKGVKLRIYQPHRVHCLGWLRTQGTGFVRRLHNMPQNAHMSQVEIMRV